jgi:riboflavin biosynthesis pyrimidine reductase
LEFVRRFDELVARKTSEAAAADIPPFATETDSADDAFIAIGNAWSRRLFDGPFYLSPQPPASDLPSASLVFVQSREGNTVAKNPVVLGGGEADKHLIYEGLSRLAADAVLSGASTIRGSDLVLSIWRPELVGLRAALGLPRHPIQIVATLHGLSLDEGLMFNLPELRVMLVTVARGMDAMRSQLAARPWVTPIVMEAAHDLPHAFRRLRQLGVERISCIGGRTIAGQLIDAGLIQDVYLTTGTKSAGEPDTPFYAKPLKGSAIVRKRGTGADAGVVFEHVALTNSKFQIPNS